MNLIIPYGQMEKFEGDKKENNLFDEKAKELNNQQCAIYVSKVNFNQYGDIEIKFSNGFVFSSFMNISLNEEGWRFFKSNAEEEHIIGTGVGIRFE